MSHIVIADNTTVIGSQKELLEGGSIEVASSAMSNVEEKRIINKWEWIRLVGNRQVLFLGTYLDLNLDVDKQVASGLNS